MYLSDNSGCEFEFFFLIYFIRRNNIHHSSISDDDYELFISLVIDYFHWLKTTTTTTVYYVIRSRQSVRRKLTTLKIQLFDRYEKMNHIFHHQKDVTSTTQTKNFDEWWMIFWKNFPFSSRNTWITWNVTNSGRHLLSLVKIILRMTDVIIYSDINKFNEKWSWKNYGHHFIVNIVNVLKNINN